MRNIILFFWFLCFTQALVAQQLNSVVFDEKAQKEVMQGYCDAEGLKTTVWSDIFDGTYNEYQPNMEVLFEMIPLMQNVEIVVTLGTWCGDSKEHVPAFLKILNEMGTDFSKVTLIGLDRGFDGGEAGYRPYDTEKVPTFIFFRDDMELGRIIETPEGTLEEHMAKIFGL
jgi:hypothetical protein